MLNQVERIEDRRVQSLSATQFIEPRQAVRPSTTASPSIVKLLALIRSAAVAIAGSTTVQSYGLRV
jgi:hypothetical protein